MQSDEIIESAANLMRQAGQIEDATAKAAMTDAAKLMLQSVIDRMNSITQTSDAEEDE